MPLPTLPDRRRSVSVELDRTRWLRYDFGALETLETQHGISLMHPEQAEAAMLSPAKFSRVVWAGCLRDDPEVTLEQIQSGMGLADLETVVQAVTAALKTSQRSRLATETEADPFVAPTSTSGPTSPAARMDFCGSSPGNSTI